MNTITYRRGEIIREISEPPRLICGLDLGQSQDPSAMCFLEAHGQGDKTLYNCRFLKRWELGTPYPSVVNDLRVMFSRVPFTDARADLAIDYTGVGRAVYDVMKRAGINARIVAITITGGDSVTYTANGARVPKRDLVSSVQVVLQTGRLVIAGELREAETLTRELNNFRVKISETGHDSYGNGADGLSWRDMGGSHDDLVLSLACAIWQDTNRRLITSGRTVGHTH